MTFINNAWPVIKASAVTWIATVLGYLTIFYAYVNTSSAHIQEVLHFSAWSEWAPWVIGLAVAFGIPIARGVKQDAVTRAVNQ